MALPAVLYLLVILVLAGLVGDRIGGGPWSGESAFERIVLSLPVGLALLAVSQVLAGLAGLPVRGTATALLAVGWLALLRFVPASGRHLPPRLQPPSLSQPVSGRGGHVALLALAFVLGVFSWKIAVSPLWSWDHHAIWGATARRIAAAGVLEPELLRSGQVVGAAPRYPLGLPVIWILLAGGLPKAVLFKVVHGLFGVLLALLVRSVAIRAGGREAPATAAAAFCAASPLFWDTEALGLADLPLALWAVAAVGLMLRSLAGPPAGGAGAGIALGFLPWLKDEGLSLAGLLLVFAAASFSRRDSLCRRRLAWVAVPAAILTGVALLIRSLLLPEGTGFFAGPWAPRLTQRLPELPEILGLLADDLVRAPWLGFWLLFPLGAAAALVARRRVSALLAAVVVAQLVIYAGVYLATYLDPAEHIRSSFFRIAAAMVPLGAIALGALAGGESEAKQVIT